MRFNKTERLGVNAIERIVIEDLNWIFREQTIVDVGIDALIEVVKNGVPSCQFIASQIKSGKGNFHEKEKCWTYYASDIHYNYWLNTNLPVILIAYIPEVLRAYWVSIESQNFIRNKRQWRIDIPKKQLFNSNSEKRLLELLEGPINTVTESVWTIEKIEELRVKVKNISNSAKSIDEISLLFEKFREINNEISKEYKVLIDLGFNLNSPQTKKVSQKLINSIKTIINNGEIHIQEFSFLFAIGIDALTQLIQGCKELKLISVLDDVLPIFENFVENFETPIKQISDLKNSVDKFTNKDLELKSAANGLSDLLSQVIREFKVAFSLTENIIHVIKNDEF